MKKTVSVFCGSSVNKLSQHYLSIAEKAGKLLSEKGYIIACGGGGGLMHRLCCSAIENGGKTIGICLNKKDIFQTNQLSRRLLYKTLYYRQKKLLAIGDAYLVLPGGIGTIYEIAEIIEKKKIRDINPDKPLIVVGNYFDHFKNQLISAHRFGFFPEKLDRLVIFENNIEKAIERIEGYFKKND